jgi:hypothetical protein
MDSLDSCNTPKYWQEFLDQQEWVVLKRFESKGHRHLAIGRPLHIKSGDNAQLLYFNYSITESS